MAFCNQCGHDNTNDAKFCQECGKPIGEAHVQKTTVSDPKRAKKIRNIIIGSVLVQVVFWTLFAVFQFNDITLSSAEGTVISKGESQDFEFEPVQCQSGENESFFGVFVGPKQKNHGGLKIYKEPSGDFSVQVEVPGSCEGNKCKAINLNRSQCDAFEIRIIKSGTQFNRIWLVDGSAKFSCKVGEGSITADIKFENCN